MQSLREIGSQLKRLSAVGVALAWGVSSASAATLYVGAEAGDYATVAAAVNAAADGDEIVIRAGTHELAAEIQLARPLTIRGATGKPEDVTLKPATSANRIAVLNHASARLDSLTLTGAAFSGEGGAVSIGANGGVIANCVIHSCKCANWGGCGGAVTMNSADALVTDCVFSNNVCSTSSSGLGYEQSRGLSICLRNGKVRNSLFVQHRQTSSSGIGGAIFMKGGEVENCTFARNEHPYCAGVCAAGGKVRNCLFVGNACASSYEGHGEVWAGTASCFTNCIAPLFINDTCIVADRIVRDCAAGDLSPLGAAIDAGVETDWQAGALDLAGRARVSGAAIDLGCYECDRAADPLNVTADKTQGVAPLTVAFTPDAFGFGGATIEWDWNGDGTFDAESAGGTGHEFAAGRHVVNARIKGTDFALTAPVEIVAIPKTLYVDPGCATPQFPYGDVEHAAKTVNEAYDLAADGCEIVLAAKEHTLTDTIAFNKAVTICGATGNPADVTVRPASSAHRFAVMSHASACFASLTLTGAKYKGEGGGISIPYGGIVSNCVVQGCKSDTWGACGGAITMDSAAALVTHCVFSNNLCDVSANPTSAQQGRGMSIRLRNGKVRNSLFVHHKQLSGNAAGGMIYMTGGEVENCTVALNAHIYNAGIFADGGKVRNCIIVGNTCTSSYEGHGEVWNGTASCFTNCIAPMFINNGCLVADRIVQNYASGNLMPVGEAIDTGAETDWQAGATDLAGNDRVSGAAIDLGCYEYDQSQVSLGVKTDKVQGFAPFVVTFTPTVFGAPGSAVEWDWNGDGTFEDETAGETTHEFAAGRWFVNARVKGTDVTLSEPLEITALPKTLFVDPDCASSQFPYADAEHAAKTVEEAFAGVVEGGEIVLVPGEHVLADTITFSKGVTIRGATGNPADVTLMPQSSAKRIAVMNCASARFESLTLTGGKYPGDGGGISILSGGGIVSNCVMHSCKSDTWGACGGAIAMDSANALVTHCVFSNNVCDVSCNPISAVQGRGMAISLKNGKVRNSLFIHNVMTSSSAAGGVISMSNGEVENCTVALNSHPYGAGIFATGGTVRNTVFVGNTCTSPYEGHGEVWNGKASCFEKCIASMYINDACIVSDRIVRDCSAEDLTPVGAAIDAGLQVGWQDGATDLAGNVRVSGAAIDLGCYEYDQSQVSLDVKTDKTQGFAPFVVTFTPNVFGVAGATVEWDWNNDGTFDDESAGETTHEFAAGRHFVNARIAGTDVTLAVPLEIAALPKTLYVDPDCATPQFPYADWDHAATSLEEAYGVAIDGSTVLLAPKEHVLADTIGFSKAVTICGATGDPADVTVRPESSAKRIAIMNNASARFESLTLTDGKFSGEGGCVSVISGGGIVSNCVMHSCKSTAWGGCGGALAMDSADALVTHCVFSNNVCDANGNGPSYANRGGMAVCLRNGKVRNSLFIGNGDDKAHNNPGGAIYVVNGEVDNCTFTGNRHTYCAGVYATGGVVRNCLIASNACTASYQGCGEVWNGSSICFEKCLGDVDEPINETCISAPFEGIFKMRGSMPYDLPASSPAVNAGEMLPWMTGATDFYGRPRVSKKVPDIGCAENQSGGGTMLILR